MRKGCGLAWLHGEAVSSQPFLPAAMLVMRLSQPHLLRYAQLLIAQLLIRAISFNLLFTKLWLCFQILANLRCVRANLSTLLDEEKLTTVAEDTTVDERLAVRKLVHICDMILILLLLPSPKLRLLITAACKGHNDGV